MELTDEFKAQGSGNIEGKQAASCHGLNGGDVWVLNETVQLDRFGNQLAEAIILVQEEFVRQIIVHDLRKEFDYE
jgi:hypothetical protein